MKYQYDCVIIGAGIAGMTAALYLKRGGFKIAIIDKGAPGGILNSIPLIENYPGFKSISGPDLAYNVFEQIKDVEFKYGNVLKIKDNIITTDIEEISANKIIIATGRTPKKITEEKYQNLSYCALCDANFYKDKTVALIGDSLEDIKYLANICKEVIVIGKANLKKENVKVYNERITKINAKDGIIYEIETNKNKHKIEGLFSCIGYEPSMEFLADIKKDNNYIIVSDTMQTSVPYIYACGDIIKKEVYQISTAIGEATQAAISVKKSIKK